MAEQLLSTTMRRGLGALIKNANFQYSIVFTFVGNENQQNAIAIQSDADFIVAYTVYDTNVAAGVPGAAFGGSLVMLTDGTQRQMANIPIPASSLFGTAQRPYVWPFTHLWRANTQIVLSVTGIAPATAQIIRFTFCGFKVPVNMIPYTGQV
jgi:hypothetical protein